MIILKTLRWSNAFSYGENNQLDLTSNQLLQLVGKNGHGKSSIALILEEVLYNKNSKGIKKGDILNRYSKAKAYSIELDLEKDGTEYQIKTKRGATQSVQLLRAGTDISSHTATQTYKQIEELIGFDHKTFAQIVYQSHAGSLEFLTAPDTARKKFLIELLNLGKYTEAEKVFKAVAAEVAKEVTALESKVSTVTQWITKSKSADLAKRELTAVPEVPDGLIQEQSTLQADLYNIEGTNKRITQNNTYKKLQSQIQLLPLPAEPKIDPAPITATLTLARKRVSDAQAFKRKIGPVLHSCPTCQQSIDSSKSVSLIAEQDEIISSASAEATQAETELAAITQQLKTWRAAKETQENWEKYHHLIDATLPAELLEEQQLRTRITELTQQIASTRSMIAKAKQDNDAVIAHNTRVDHTCAQLAEMNQELDQAAQRLGDASTKYANLNTLVKTFSTTGLVAYKIENLVKDLEEISNEYLGELSGGRFQIGFQITGSDKLNVVITDNGNDIDINALSGGERARVNIATLLAIRKLMQALSKSRINLLILDETVEALDVDGKEKLIEVLLHEESLNTVLVSHGFSHPLLEKVHVVKSNNISNIEV